MRVILLNEDRNQLEEAINLLVKHFQNRDRIETWNFVNTTGQWRCEVDMFFTDTPDPTVTRLRVKHS